jgi:prepilin-type N-terminal cleavage/methylation domain-containing protein
MRVQPRSSGGGFTLVELMAVIAIVGVMAAIAMATMGRSGDAENSAALARSLHLAVMSARNATLSDSFIRRVNCTLAATNGNCTIDRACQAGMTLPNSCTFTQEQRVTANSHATLWNVTSSTDNNANNAGGTQVTSTKTMYLKPDGSVCDNYATVAAPTQQCTSNGFTFYVSDINGSNLANRYKVYVYSFTGMPRMVNQW